MKVTKKIITIKEAIKLYLEMCREIVRIIDKENFLISSDQYVGAIIEKYPTARKHIQNNDIEYLRYLEKQMKRIAKLDRTNLESSITEKNSTLHLELNEKRVG